MRTASGSTRRTTWNHRAGSLHGWSRCSSSPILRGTAAAPAAGSWRVIEYSAVSRCGTARHDVTRRDGHIGYGVRPSARRCGVATWALGEMLTQAKGFGLERVLIVCEADNTASIKTIERHGGVLDTIRKTEHGHVRHYWIELDTRFVVVNDAVDPSLAPIGT